jgi:HEAT repeat protein
VKFNTVIYSLLAAVFITAVLLALNWDRLVNLGADGNSPEKTAAPTPPLATTDAQKKPSAIDQLLAPNSQLSTEIPDAEAPTVEPEELQSLEEALNDFYSSEDGQDREMALMDVGEYADPKAKEAILYALNDPEDVVREQAVSQIDGWGDEKERQEMLLTALNNDKPDIVVLALEAIAEVDDPSLLQKIRELSQDKNEEVSEAAKAALEMSDTE